MASSLYVEHLKSEELTAITQYKYRGEDRSITYKYVMGPLYTRLINYCPMWIAPNTITLIGFILTAAAHLQLMFYVPNLTEDAPQYVYLFGGISLFVYMVLDNLDGKQARRTGSSSPLGQLFDHGCDALNVTLSGMSLLATVQLGPGLMSMTLLYALGHLMLFGATLEEYHTGAMVLRELNGPNEGILTLCMFQIVTGLFGPHIWRTQVPIPWSDGASAQLNHVTYYVAVIPTITSAIGNVFGIWQHHRRAGKSVMAAGMQVLTQMVSIVTYGICFNGWALFAKSHFQRQSVWIMWLSGGVTFDLISRMMLAHLAKAPFPYSPRLMWPVIAGFVSAVLAEHGFEIFAVDKFTVMIGLGVGAYNLWRSWCLVSQLCEFLNVRCFSLQALRKEERAVR